MLDVEILLASFSVITGYIAVGMLRLGVKKVPITEMKLFALGIASYVTSFPFLFLIAMLNDVSMRPYISPISVLSFRMGSIFAVTGIFLMIYSIFVPSFKDDYKHVFIFLVGITLAVGAALANFFTSSLFWEGTFVRTQFGPRGLTLLTMLNTLLAIMIIIRVKEIRNVLNNEQRKSPFTSHLNLAFFAFLVVLMIITAVAVEVTPFLPLPTLTWTAFASLFFIQLSWNMMKDPTFFFITPVRLDAVLVITKESGLLLYSSSYRSDMGAKELLASILTALNITLQALIVTGKSFTEITFGDKTLVIVPKASFMLIMIVSEQNFIVKSVSTLLATMFETMFQQELLQHQSSNFVTVADFQSFNQVVQSVRPLVPL